MPFYTSKGALLQRKRRPFTLPFVIVWNSESYKDENKRIPPYFQVSMFLFL